VLRRIWDVGYSGRELVQLFTNLPPQLRVVMDQGLNAMETLLTRMSGFRVGEAEDNTWRRSYQANIIEDEEGPWLRHSGR